MFDYKNASIQTKFTLGSIFVSAIVIVGICAVFIAYEYSTYKRDVIHNLLSVEEIVSKSISAAIVFDDSDSAQNELESLTYIQNIFGTYVYDAEGKLFASFERGKKHFPDEFKQDYNHFKEHFPKDVTQKKRGIP